MKSRGKFRKRGRFRVLLLHRRCGDKLHAKSYVPWDTVLMLGRCAESESELSSRDPTRGGAAAGRSAVSLTGGVVGVVRFSMQIHGLWSHLRNAVRFCRILSCYPCPDFVNVMDQEPRCCNCEAGAGRLFVDPCVFVRELVRALALDFVMRSGLVSNGMRLCRRVGGATEQCLAMCRVTFLPGRHYIFLVRQES